MKRKLFTLLTLLLTVCSGAWAAVTYSGGTPATVEYGTGDANKTFLDVSSTTTNATIKSGSVGVFAIDMNYLVRTWQPEWLIITKGSPSNSSYSYSNITDYGFLSIASSSSYDAYTQSYGYAQVSTSRSLEFYVTGITGIALLQKDNASNKKTIIKVEEYNEDGTLGSANQTTNSTGNTDIHILSYAASSLSGSKYYKVTLIGDNSSSCTIYQLRFTPSSLADVAAPTSLTCSAQTSTSLTYTWSKAEHASGYVATLYSDSGCSSQVATQNLGDVATVTFSELSASTTYYCKVQSKGDGETYKVNGETTTAVSGTTSAKAYTVTTDSNNDEWGTATAEAVSLDAGETSQITAFANSDYKFVSWAVSGDGSSLSSNTDNPTTLTIGTANATVTATFRELYTYTITYNSGANGTGTIDAGEKKEDSNFTLSSSTFSRDGYVQTGWSTEDGGDKAYDLGDTYTDNNALNLYPFWTAAFTLTYDANGGTDTMDDSKGVGSITLAANAFTKSGYSFIGWATSKANADAGTVAYADRASYTLNEDATLYAVWAENYCYLAPATSGDALSNGDVINVQSGSFGGQIKALSANLSYTTNGLQFGTSSSTKANVELNDYMEPGTMIILTMVNPDANKARGLKIANSEGTVKATLTATTTDVFTKTYTVVENDGLAGKKEFQLHRNENTILKSLTVINAQPGATLTSTGWNTYSSNKALDLSTLTDGFTAYVAKEIRDGQVIMSSTDAIVPANTGLMIKGTAGAEFTIDATNDNATFSGNNLLLAMPTGGEVTAADNTKDWNYVFGYEDEETYGFYRVNEEAAKLGLGKAYLHTTEALATAGGSARLGIVFEEFETTGIQSVRGNSMETNTIFDMQGRRVAQPTKGLYIQNGKKVVIK